MATLLAAREQVTKRAESFAAEPSPAHGVPAALEWPLDRRGFLRVCTGASVLFAVAPILGHARDAYPAADGLAFFTAKEFAIAVSIAEAILPPGADTHAVVRRMDAALVGNASALQDDFRTALTFMEYGPMILNWTFSRFSRMPVDNRLRVLEDWLVNGFELQRVAVWNFRRGMMFLYYAEPAGYKITGYDGPLIPADQVLRP